MSILLTLGLVLACKASTPAQAPPVAPPEGSARRAVAINQSPVRVAAQPLVGIWQSDSCGDARTYVRAIAVDDNGMWRSRDMVSPCPPGTQCMWSGIVEANGTWLPAEPLGTIQLNVGSAAPRNAPGEAPPSSLSLKPGQVVDDLGCSYKATSALP